jgi:lincosamide nucleotidyltransferase A/C/D/E
VLSDAVLEVVEALDLAGVRHWVAGGWGVDALVGRQTREHRDLDLAVDAEDAEACARVLDGLGYQVETDWLPVRVELVARGRGWVDVHPVRFDADGRGLQGDVTGTHFLYPPDAFVRGVIGGRPVGCLSVSQQQVFHTGYALRPQDEHDLGLLATLAAGG